MTTALIVVDAQQGFVNAHSRDVVAPLVRLVREWQRVGAPLVFARFHNSPDSPYERVAGWTRLRTADEQAIIAELAPYVSTAAAVIDKGTSSVFTPDGARTLKQQGWSDLAFCGIDTDSCVLDSAVAAFHAGYRPWIVSDACASSGGPEYHEAALLLARRNISSSQVITSDQALAMVEPKEAS